MDISYSPEVEQSPEWSLVMAASERLPAIGSPEAVAGVEAHWSQVLHRTGQRAYRLSLRDANGEVFTDYTPDMLRNSQQMRFDIYQAWGDLLQIRSDLQHGRVRELYREYAAAEGG